MSNSEIEKASAELERRRFVTRASLLKKQAEIYEKIPEVKALTEKINRLGAEKAFASVSKNAEEARAADEEIKKTLQEREKALEGAGYSEDDLTEKHFCPHCNDTGYVNGNMCSCMKELVNQFKQLELSRLSPMPAGDFESFSLDYYPKDEITLPNGEKVIPHKIMEGILSYCKSYAEKFKRGARSLIFIGSSGLGKTHLACAIARVCREKGYTVMYTSCQTLFNMIEQSRYTGESDWEKVLDCDLLVLDDLGAENMTSYCLSALYNIINTRMIENRRCIYTTNLSTEAAFRKRYGEKITSRIFGSCHMFYFQGDDIRLIKNNM